MKYNISQLKPEIKKFSHFYQGLLLEEDKEQENNERDILYNNNKQINDSSGVKALILVPTHELAEQVS